MGHMFDIGELEITNKSYEEISEVLVKYIDGVVELILGVLFIEEEK